MHNEETFKNLEEPLTALKELLRSQREHIQKVEHERDPLAAGYKAAMEKCAELEVHNSDSIAN